MPSRGASPHHMFSDDDQPRGKGVGMNSLIVDGRDVNLCTIFDKNMQLKQNGNHTHNFGNFGSQKHSDSTERHSLSEMRPSKTTKNTFKNRTGNSIVVTYQECKKLSPNRKSPDMSPVNCSEVLDSGFRSLENHQKKQ